MILVIIAAWLGYKRASANGRNGWVWALITASVFLGAQVIVGLAIGVAITFGIEAWGWQGSTFEDYYIATNFVAAVASFLAAWPLLRWLDKPVDRVEAGGSPPPPPPQF